MREKGATARNRTEPQKVGLVTSVINPIMPGGYARCTIEDRNGKITTKIEVNHE
ncbi:hypothetical protein PaVLD_ORF093L [Planktothrix phage PaV-LD]|uniref:hypothetical protein n=1 Tax=Planktothrix phage PaV-LD TaxID=994601 RepID=UPI000243C92C|nr:hypothetical protein PaVLD_ORF093L [Planktothrix phage PaV-LD]ADZ31600.1 hypothetical protein PaVLD_ORF093L [Planktothrix phage PaV-LD]